MKKSFVSYIRKISKGDSNSLQGIFDYKFKKFDCFYDIIKDYTSYIEDIEYLNNDDINTLDVIVRFNNKKSSIKKLFKEIESICDSHNSYITVNHLFIDNEGKIPSLNISLILKERDYLPLNEENEEGESCNET